jgi:hypothetical protein
LHRLSASFFLGYHGCRREVGEALVAGTPFWKSENEWDWLGPGAYFWEANPQRALDWAREQYGDAEAFAVGAVIDPGLCLDLTTASGLAAVREAYDRLVELATLAKAPLPRNVGQTPDKAGRKLDCAVIRTLHEINSASGQAAIDTVKGVFVEDLPLYEGAGFRARTHIQHAVCNLDCIKGVFRVLGL